MCRRSFLRYGLLMLLAMALLPCCDKEHDEAAFTNPFDPDNPETHGDPYNLQVNARADGVQLKWDKVANVSEIIVYRSTSPDGGFERIGTSTSGEYVDTDTQTGVTYYYQVRAYARGVEASGSRLTNASTVRINTPPTSAIVHHELDKNTLLVQWKGSDADGSVKSYLIKLDDGEWTDVGTQTEFRKEDLAEGVHRFYVKSKDNLGAEEAEAQVLEFTVDTSPPSNAGITIEEGNTTNSRTVTLSLSASDAIEMRIGNSSSFSGSIWEAYSSTRNWTLSSGDGTKTVYAQFRDAAGNESSTVSDTIVLDASAPSGSISINDGASYTTNRAVTLNLSASGATEMRISNTSSFSGSSWEVYSSTKSWTLSSGDGTKTVYAQFRDAAGNESSTVSDTIVLDASAPSGSISINSGASYTTNRAVTLSLSASGAIEMRISNSSSFSGISWEAYSSTKSWTLSSGDGTKTVYAQFRDAAGNESDTVSGTIALDTSAPSGSISINGGASTTASLNVALSLSASGATEMRISNSSSFSGISWETYSSTKSWTLLSGDGKKTVYAQFRDAAGNESDTVSDTIALDTSAPSGSIGINGGASTTASLNVALSLSASGATEMRISNSSSFSGISWETYSSTKSWTLSSGDGTKIVYAQFQDAAGNESDTVSDSIELDTQAPSGSISINNGASYTSDRSVTLSLSASGATEMRISNSSSFGGISWETYSSTKSWTLSSGDGTKTVYAQFRDAAGNESIVVSDTIVLATSAPVIDDMVLIPAGEFSMGDAFDEGESDELPVHTVYLDAFYMDKYEVTNTQYAAFLNQYGKNTDASGNELLDIGSSDCQIEEVDGSFRAKSGYENHPVVEMSWYGAVAYAEFYGKRLPTEAEWEKAARGGLAGKRYPWGDNISHDDANYNGTGGRDVWNGTSPVGSFAPNGYGLYDMAGNVWEWCADWYSSGYYAGTTRSNPQGPGSGTYRVMRGGGWGIAPDYLRVAYRFGEDPIYMGSSRGFRCGASLND